MGILRKNGLARAFALCEWPCLFGMVTAIILLVWQVAAPNTIATSLAEPTYGYQRTLADLESNCRQELYQPSVKEVCIGGCTDTGFRAATVFDMPDFGWSVLTCSDNDHYHSAPAYSGSLQNMAIEVIQAARMF